MSRFHELRVNSIDRETSEAVSVGFEIPKELEEDFRFVAGQYLTLEKEIAGKKFRRSYSICTSPESGEVKVAVKQIADGRFSSWVNRKLKVGDYLNVFLPEGRFVYQPEEGEKGKVYAAFAAGSGITPIMAILKNVLSAEPNSKFILVYGNKTPEQTMFYEELIRLRELYADRFYLHFVFSQIKPTKSPLQRIKNSWFRKKETSVNSEEETPIYGRINSKIADFIVKQRHKDLEFEDLYLCGPQAMIEAVSSRLKDHGIPEDKIHFELFVTEENQNPMENEREGKTRITVILDEEEVSFEMDRKQRVLDAAIEQELDPPYSCLGGICSSCLAQIKEGKATMVNNQILTEREVEAGLVLTCQAHPTTATLVVDYDDI